MRDVAYSYMKGSIKYRKLIFRLTREGVMKLAFGIAEHSELKLCSTETPG
jgi:hypothetical protein